MADKSAKGILITLVVHICVLIVSVQIGGIGFALMFSERFQNAYSGALLFIIQDIVTTALAVNFGVSVITLGCRLCRHGILGIAAFVFAELIFMVFTLIMISTFINLGVEATYFW